MALLLLCGSADDDLERGLFCSPFATTHVDSKVAAESPRRLAEGDPLSAYVATCTDQFR